MPEQDESGTDRVQNREWIADLLERVDFVAWDRFTVGEINDFQIVDVYGWIDRDDEYKDFVWSRFWPENENLEYTTSSDEYTKEIERIWFGEASAGHNPCRRVENTFDVDNAIVLDEPELVTDGGDPEMKSIECPNCGMPYTVPEEVDHWSCDCGASWELDPRTDGGQP